MNLHVRVTVHSVLELCCVLLLWIFSFLVTSPCQSVMDRVAWHSTELKDHFCTAFVYPILHTECRPGRLLLWKFQETWLDAPTNPQVSCCSCCCCCFTRTTPVYNMTLRSLVLKMLSHAAKRLF